MIMRNTVILVDQIDHDRAAGLLPLDAIVESTVRRARPVVLTALAAILAMIPLARSVFWGPMAVSMMGGLLVATVLTLRHDRELLWLGPAVLAGWWAHLIGDLCTSDRWPALAPFTFREFGGWRLIRPTPRGRRVTRTERLIESLLLAACCAAVVTLAGWWPPLLDAAGRAIATGRSAGPR
jgi:hypothetical protein